ncbi:MAG: DUF2975 domain-containing protein [Chitinophaga sp.]|uniref:DUF2975 domain-containing protein n=1 Tax=Chitinophaga sp. TaxID=1869181 RepID=UPI001B25779A|nr:DUF2975 domain-containing protein [Chitinophaga sp.]MBO9732934.1 DUF2975 domain-containing protein [Chitinophaga sp.]
MKNKSSQFYLKTLIITSVLVGVAFGLVAAYRMQSALVLLMFLGVGAPALAIAVLLYRLAATLGTKEIISRDNLMRVQRIRFVLLTALVVKAVIVMMVGIGNLASIISILMIFFSAFFSSWELLIGILIIHILAKVFEGAIILKEEEALTI